MNTIKYLRLLVASTFISASVSAFGLSETDRWSDAWGQVRGEVEYYDESGSLTTGTVQQAVITDAHNAAMERAQALGTSVPKALYWRSNRGRLRAFKAWIKARCDYFVDERLLGINDNWNVYLADNWETGSGVTNHPVYTPETLLEENNLPTNYFEHTPWFNLHSSSNGWAGIKDCMESMTIVDHEVGSRYPGYYFQANEDFKIMNVTNRWEEEVWGYTNWADAKAAVDNNLNGTIEEYYHPRDFSRGHYDDEYDAERHIYWQTWMLEMKTTNYHASVDMYLFGEHVWDDFGTGLIEGQLAYYKTVTYTNTSTNVCEIPIGNTNRTLNAWAPEPTSEDPFTYNGWVSGSDDGDSDTMALYFFLDYSVANGFKYR